MSQYTATADIPFYRQMIALLRYALDLLDEQGREEVFQFLVSQQNIDGGFQDRGGRSDLYYSLFGGMMLRAWSMEQRAESVDSEDRRPNSEAKHLEPETWNLESVKKLKWFISHQSTPNVPGFIEKCCLVLLQKELKTGRNSQIKALISLGRSFWQER
ncbi:MAG: prenyltransferase/squalene oxidase repeat-containing protein, partial [Bacteroidota bacterium]|nr:prenyltransferase/squalene oxidase repeat-containing protein [Bacteroidota bacterium]